MSKLTSRLLILTGVGFIIGSLGPVQAYIDNSQFELERSRNALLDKRNQQSKLYQQLMRDSDDLNRQLSQVQMKIRYLGDDMKQTDMSLRDLEYSLRHN